MSRIASLTPHLTGPMFGAQRFDLLPLISRQSLPQIEEHSRIRFLEFRPRLRHGIDLCQDFPLIRLIGFDHRVQQRLLLLEIGVQVNQLQPMLHENVVHLVLLLIAQAQLLRHMRIVPPASKSPIVESPLHGRRPSKTLSPRSRSGKALCNRQARKSQAKDHPGQKAIPA
jgi:hypothetical protein